VSSFVTGTQGFAALELLFHEASHSLVFPRSGVLATAIARAATEQHKDIPPSLWHTLIFYTAGEVTRRHLADYAVEYAPFGFHERLYTGDWKPYWAPMAQHGQAFLDGKLGLEEAIGKIVADLPAKY